MTATYYSPYSGDRLEVAANEVTGCDLVVMHCMGYTEHMRGRVVAALDKPVLLARRIVAGAIQQVI